MTYARTTLFTVDQSQASKPPHEVAFGDGVCEFVITRDGSSRIIEPAGGSWDAFFNAPGIDIGEPRDQPGMELRDAL